jgi:hypothetical protein
MPLRGAFTKPQDSLSLISFGPEPVLSISVNDGVKVNRDVVYDLLSGPSEDQPSGVQANPGEVVFRGLALWLSLREPGLYSLWAEGQSADRMIYYPHDNYCNAGINDFFSNRSSGFLIG